MKLMSFVISKVSANHTRRLAHPSCQAVTGKLYESVVGFQNQSASFCCRDKNRKQRWLPLSITEDGEDVIREAAATEFSTHAAVVYQSLIILGLKDQQRTELKSFLGRQSSFQRCGAWRLATRCSRLSCVGPYSNIKLQTVADGCNWQ